MGMGSQTFCSVLSGSGSVKFGIAGVADQSAGQVPGGGGGWWRR